MIGAWFEIEADLLALSPLRVADGHRKKWHRPERAEGEDEDSRVATVQTDCDGRPCIPGSTLKGVLRRHSAEAGIAFGPPSIRDERDARAGLVTCFTARMTHSGSVPVARHGDRETDGITLEVGIARDPEAGAAAAGRLFHAETVVLGSRFRWRVRVHIPKEEERHLGDWPELFRNGAFPGLLSSLKAFSHDDGISFGRSTRQGIGRLQLDLSTMDVKVAARGAPAAEGARTALKRAISAAEAPSTPAQTFTLTLTCDGPFLIVDNLRPHETGDRDSAQIGGLEAFDGSGPRLTGATLLGALRSRFDWWARQERPFSPSETEGGYWALAQDTPTERLFGHPGWKGRIAIESIKQIGNPTRKPITSVRLDRFSQAPIDNALFTTDAWIGAAFKVRMRIDTREVHPITDPDAMKIQKSDQGDFREFLSEITDPDWGGLDLGHSINRGFGWFEVALSGWEWNA